MEYNVDYIKFSGSILAKVLEEISSNVIRPGISTLFLDQVIKDLIFSFSGATPAFLGYKNFPGSACISVNHQAVHAIPNNQIIKEGDIVSVDCGVIYKGNFTDACRTIGIGNISAEKSKLIKTTSDALDAGIKHLVPGSVVGDVSYQIQKVIERNNLQVSLDFCGHGIGTMLHDDPQIPNYGPPGRGPPFLVGKCYALEPVVFSGNPELFLDTDGWSVASSNGVLSCHFEDTILLTENGPEIITRLNT